MSQLSTEQSEKPLPGAMRDEIRFDAQGLIPAIAQDADSGEILMVAWMNAAALAETLESGRVCYWSRSRKALWRKGESSGQYQTLLELQLDCDGDTLLLRVRQEGVACHTGRRSCFYRSWNHETRQLDENAPVLVSPEELYGKVKS